MKIEENFRMKEIFLLFDENTSKNGLF